ncbi:uncharacterized protein [Euphorbia lathyris]|uniref:uncharacterized protein isoform X2 n=1 Tax=Euphorbia lathyris TaxID=212925 RepID=UPI0033137088
MKKKKKLQFNQKGTVTNQYYSLSSILCLFSLSHFLLKLFHTLQFYFSVHLFLTFSYLISIEMALEAILPILVELIKNPITVYVVSPIKRQLSYAFKCDSKIQNLHDEVVQLKDKKDRLEKSVSEASRNGEEIYENVTRWLSSVENYIEEAEKLIQGKEEAEKKCFVGVCPDLKARYQLSKKADKKSLAIDVLVRDAEGFGPISFCPALEQIIEPSVYNREALPSRMLILNQIMDALKDPNLNMIGVYGMGGVGKTTLAKEVQAKAVEEKLFETVVMVAVSQTPELRRIQGEIADFLGLKFDVEEVLGRASQLYQRLKKSKVLIILDDLWQKLELNAVGIPFGDSGEGCKLLLTSRSMDVLRNEMETQREFSLGVLGEEEAWSLFQTVVAKSKDPQLHAIAAEVAKKCAGLPLLIIIVAKELQNKELYAWVDMQKKLSGFGNEDIHRRVHKVLESSFENLRGEEVKSLFLLCSLFSESNIQIHCLLIYSMGLGLFKQIVTVEEARNRLFTLIDKLKAECLLLDGDKDGFVKMHDVVRDAAISIASRLQNVFVGADQVRLRDWPKQNCTRISLPYCNISQLPTDLECPEADLFLLFTEDVCLEIPDSFFKGIRKLKVVDFTGMHLMSLPSSLGLLANLSTLSLHRCRLDNIAIIGELKQLELLSFGDSKIGELPREIGQLTQLKLLDLRRCSRLQVIPANVLSKLCLLEELYMLKSFDRWDTKGNVSLMELENLSHLSTLEIQIGNPKLIPKGCRFFDGLGLRSYKISVGDGWDWDGRYGTSRTLKLKLEFSIHLMDGIEVLLRGSEDVYLDEVRGIDLDGEGFPQLKHLHIQNDSDNIKYLIKSTRPGSCHAFAILESLNLKNLKRLEKICNGQLGMGSFRELRVLKISNCDKLTNVFSFSSATCLPELKKMEVYYCANMEAIVGEGSEVMEFTQLSSLKLGYLPHLKGFCGRKEGTEETRILFNEMVSFPNLTSLDIRECKSLKYIFTTSMVKCLVKLKNLVIWDCELVEEIMLTKKFKEIEESIDQIVFLKLDYLKLYKLPNLKRFNCGYPIEFSLLRELNIEKCLAMENFVSKFPERSNNNGSDEYLFNGMVTFSKLEIMNVDEMGGFRYLWNEQFITDDSFSKLKSLHIRNCSKLSVVFPSNVCRRFQRLEKLSIYLCCRVEEIYQHEEKNISVQTFSLRDLAVSNLQSLKHIWNKDVSGAFTFENLQSVSVFSCEDLKYVFPASITSGLLQLQRLHISQCGVEMIISKVKTEELKGAPSFKFPQLTFLHLVDLNEMRSLYQGSHTLEWPKLKSLEVRGCPEIMKFGSKISSYHREHNLPIPQSLFFADQKFIPNLEELTIDDQSFNAIHESGAFPIDFFSKVKKVKVNSLEEESIPFLFGFLRRLCSLEMLVFCLGSLEEISLLDDDRTVGEEERPLRLKHLELSSLGKLKHIIKKDSQPNSILQYLQTLNVQACYNLKDIALSSTSYFQNLTTLYVYGCHKMTKLVTASTAKAMVQLMQIKVEYCMMMEEMIAKDRACTEHDAIILNKLKCLEFNYLDRLKSFCSGNYTINFPLLEQVTVRSCSRMKIFCGGVLSTPKLRGVQFNGEKQWEGDLNATIAYQLKDWVGGHFEEGRLFQNVGSLEVVKDAFFSKAILANQLQFLNRLLRITVRDCDSLQVVFDLEGLSTEDGHVGLLPKLNELNLINLPMLSRLCNKPPTGILDFNKLQVLKIKNCSKLSYAFTWSMASCLVQLRKIELKNCEMMERIIKGEEAEDAARVILPSLNSVVVECLPKFSSFYSGIGDLECPLLEKISIRKCSSIKAFISRLPREDRESKEEPNIHSSHKVFPNLNELTIDINSITAILQFELPMHFFLKVEKLGLQYCSVTSTRSHAPLLHLLSRLPNLVKLELIWWRNSQFHSSLFQSIKTLEVRNCGNLIDLASSSTSFENLTTLQLYGCNQLINLITSSVAKCMMQLERLSVEYCDMLTEIVGDGNDGTTDEIVFMKMKTLELTNLQSLESFSLGSYTFKFPCLENVFLYRCPNLRSFCPGSITAPMLENVKHGLTYKHYWEGDLNATVQRLYMKMIGFNGLIDLKLSKFPMLKEKWGDQFPFKYFFSLKRLVVDDCALFSNAISSHLLQHLVRLEVLTVEKCDSVEQVFDLEVLNGAKPMKNLNQFKLIDLPRLRHVWSKDPQQIMSFKNLQLLKVHNCDNLIYIFNLSMALRLPKLEHVEVKKCSLVEHIIVKAEEETMLELQTIFPSLKSINLQHLTSLSSFYSASGFLECPSLKIIEVVECPNTELFPSAFSGGQHSSMIIGEKEEWFSNKDPDSMAAILRNKIAIPRLEELKVEWNSLKDILNDNDQPEFLSKLKVIELTGFQCEYAILPSNFLQKIPKLEKLALSDDLIEGINLHGLSFRNDKDPESLALLSKLKLSNLPKLKHLVHDDSHLVPLFQNLEDLEVIKCSRLKILVPSSVSFQNLTNLQVSKCEGLMSLITASTARSLVQLKKMVVKECKMMQEIVAITPDELECEIRFSQLECLELDDLPCLASFSSGNYDFYFPSLEEVVVIGCPNMKTFACSVTPKLKEVKTGRRKYERGWEWEWEGSLNNTIRALYIEEDAEEADARNM